MGCSVRGDVRRVRRCQEQPVGPAALVRRVEELRATAGGRSASVLLVIDQAEELLTRAAEQESIAFLGLLDGALRHDPRLWVLATLRSEFLTGLLTTVASHPGCKWWTGVGS